VYEDVARKYRGEIGGRNPGLDNGKLETYTPRQIEICTLGVSCQREREREREIYICKEVK
jgi:hypothetical protein